jgi:DNA polymerase (family X)
VVLAQAQDLARRAAELLVEAGARQARTAGAVRRGHEIIDELTMVVEGLGPSEVARVLADPNLGLRTVRLVDDGVVLAEPAGHQPGPSIRAVSASSKDFLERLLRETGSPAHLEALDARALARGLSLAQLCQQRRDEAEVYAALDLPFIPPELREDGSLSLPDGLLAVRGVRGVFHVHTTWSDGTASVCAMARAAAEAGYQYVGISDHSKAASYANGLDEDRLAAQCQDVDRARREVPEIAILHGIEVDVLDDGALDLPDSVLVQLDFVVASLHTRFSLDAETQTARMVRALRHPLVTILGHPTGRLLLGREGYLFDFDAVADAAAEHGVALEINASPQRLDLGPDLIRRAARRGAQFCINPDAHEIRGFDDVPLGIAQARRAALMAGRVLNTLDHIEITRTLRERRRRGAAQLGLVAPREDETSTSA